VAIDLNTYPPPASSSPVVVEGKVGTGTQYNPSSRIEASSAGNFEADIVFLSNNPGAPDNGLMERMRITPGGTTVYGTMCTVPLAASIKTGGPSDPAVTNVSVGIGTATPRSAMEATVNAPGALGPVVTLTNTGGNANASAALDLNTYSPSATGTYNPSSRIEALDTGNYSNHIIFLANKPGAANSGLVETMRITTAGVGIGEENPAAALHITDPSNAPPGALAASDNGLLLGSNGTSNYKWIQSYGGPLGLNPMGNNVGVGTESPIAPLHLAAPALGNSNLPVGLIESNSSNNPSPRLGFVDTSLGANASAPVWFIDNSQDNFRIFRQPNAATAGAAWLTINNAGLISVAGDIVLTGADCAEQFDVTGAAPPEPGTVLVIDKEGYLRESSEAYDKKVAGVVSGAGEYRHGILLDGKPSDERRVPLALTGKVYCKVDAQYSPIEVGDLLTTSPTPGHAMKATEGARAFGSVIGKALRALEGGQGLVPILVSLQ